MQAALAASDSRRVPVALVTAVITIAAYAAHIGVREFMGAEPGSPLRLAVTAALVIAFSAHVIVTVRTMRRLDEFQKSVQLTALAFAFPASMIALFALGFFRAEGLLSEMDPRDLVMIMLLAYAAGLTWAWRRY
jgi:hypothetical protein